jgi:hypothetical protein
MPRASSNSVSNCHFSYVTLVSLKSTRLSGSTSETELRNLDGANSPGLATVAGCHVTSDPLALGHSVDIVRVRDIEDNLGIGPGCSTKNISRPTAERLSKQY